MVQDDALVISPQMYQKCGSFGLTAEFYSSCFLVWQMAIGIACTQKSILHETVLIYSII